jgi:molybdate transport system substrate-binding protein
MPEWIVHAAMPILLAGFAGAAGAAEITVSAAASLTTAFKALAPLFAAANPGVDVRLNFASSGALLQQMAAGASVDVFASADAETMDRAQSRKLIDAAWRRDFASNTLVLVVPATAAAAPSALADLARPEFERIAIGLPASVPVGRYTKGALDAAGLWAAIEPKMIRANNVRQALDYVARGEVDAGFVFATDAATMPGKVRIAFTVPTATPILYPVAPVAGSSNPAHARRFVEFLSSQAARAVLMRHGFGTP